MLIVCCERTVAVFVALLETVPLHFCEPTSVGVKRFRDAVGHDVPSGLWSVLFVPIGCGVWGATPRKHRLCDFVFRFDSHTLPPYFIGMQDVTEKKRRQ